MTTYSSPGAFRDALEARIRRDSPGAEMQRGRQRVVFQRFLARVSKMFGEHTILKGGLALEIRLENARSTRDIDLAFFGPGENLLQRLQAAGQLDLRDFMTFEVQPNNEQLDVVGDGVVYGGKRFRIECKLAGRLYGSRFGLDVVFGGPVTGALTVLRGKDYLSFADIEAPELRLLPVATHIAEKLHAYSLPRTSPNSRVRDLPDLALLATTEEQLNSDTILNALRATFSARKTHDVPKKLPDPPENWKTPYEALVSEHQLSWRTLSDVTKAAKLFLDPVLSGDAVGQWDRSSWSWR